MLRTDERVAVLEAHRIADAMDLAELRELVERIDRNVQAIEHNMHKQRGFIAGMLFVLTPIWAIVLFFLKDLWSRMTGK